MKIINLLLHPDNFLISANLGPRLPKSKIQEKLSNELVESLNDSLDTVVNDVVKNINFNHELYQITVELNAKFVNLEQLSQRVVLKKINKKLFTLESDSTFSRLSVSYLTLDVEVATSDCVDTVTMITDLWQF